MCVRMRGDATQGVYPSPVSRHLQGRVEHLHRVNLDLLTLPFVMQSNGCRALLAALSHLPVPDQGMNHDEKTRPCPILSHLHSKVIGQDEAHTQPPPQHNARAR